MKRGTYQSVVERNQPILKRISALKAEHPYWGYRRIHEGLRFSWCKASFYKLQQS